MSIALTSFLSPQGSRGTRIEAVLLDLDGTLVDTQHAWGTAFAEVLEYAAERYPTLERLGDGVSVHADVFQPLVHQIHLDAGYGEWDQDYLRRAFAELLARHAGRDDTLADEMFERYVEGWPEHVGLFPDVLPTLEVLHGRYRLAVVSNGLGPDQRSKVERLGLEPYISALAISGDLGVLKPDPAIFEHALESLGVEKGRAIHIGDDLYADVGGAHAAGLAAGIWLNRTGGASEETRPPSGRAVDAPDAELRSLDELPALLGVET